MHMQLKLQIRVKENCIIINYSIYLCFVTSEDVVLFDLLQLHFRVPE